MSPVGDQQHSFVAILVAARCNVREVSEWAGHNNVAFTLTRYGLFEDGSDEAVDRLDSLLGGADPASAEVVELRRAEDLNPCCPPGHWPEKPRHTPGHERLRWWESRSEGWA